MTLMEKLNDWVRTFSDSKNAEFAAEIMEFDHPDIASEQMSEKISEDIQQAEYILELIFVPQGEDNYIASIRLYESRNEVEQEIPSKLIPKAIATLEAKTQGDLDTARIEEIWGTHHLFHIFGDDDTGFGVSFYSQYCMLTRWDSSGGADVSLSREEVLQACGEIRDTIDEIRPMQGLPGVHAPEF